MRVFAQLEFAVEVPNLETTKVVCQQQGWTEPVVLDVAETLKVWAYPPNGVMRMPFELPKQINITCLKKASSWVPVKVYRHDDRLAYIESDVFQQALKEHHLKHIWQEKRAYPFQVADYYVRDDAYPLIWLYWWFFFG